MKTCRLCGQEKPVDEFYLRGDHSGLRRAMCIACIKEKAVLRRKDNPDRVRAQDRASARTRPWAGELKIDLSVVKMAGPLAACAKAIMTERPELTMADVGRICDVSHPAVAKSLARAPQWPVMRSEYVLVDRELLGVCGPWTAVMDAACRDRITREWTEYTMGDLCHRLNWSPKTVGRYMQVLIDRGIVKARRKKSGKAGGTREYKLEERS